jgi:hypothetical protein
MELANSRSIRRPARAGALLCLCLAAGCATLRPGLDRTLKKDTQPGAPARPGDIAEPYAVRFPDVIELTVDGRPALDGRFTIGPDGRIGWGPQRSVRIEGQTLPDCARILGEEAGVPPVFVHIQVAEFNSRQIYLFGPGIDMQRTVPYRGPETVLELLHRAGVTGGATASEVDVVRPHVAEGLAPETFHIDPRAITDNHDTRTNIRLQPFDEVHIGEGRRSRLEKSLPSCLRPIFDFLCGLHHTPNDPPKDRPTGEKS